jgi:tRNA threonylcarbamoyl adenosine modification protein YjeE
MERDTDSVPVWQIELRDEAATQHLARQIAGLVGPDDLVTLSGDLGAGKTTFARELIRWMTGDPELEVPSPTFTLMQVYDGPQFPIVHADLYRVVRAAELAELGWDEAAEGALVLVEWAERAGPALSQDRLDISFAMDAARGDQFRSARLAGHGAFGPRLARAMAIEDLLRQAGWEGASRRFMLGDASTRAYERLTRADGATAVLMISPPRADGPPIRYGKPYSALVHLAEDIRPFLAMAEALRLQGLSAPAIYAADAPAGLALIEDLGQEGVVDADGPIPERYGEAASVLALLHGRDLPRTVPVGDGGLHDIPTYDVDALCIEAELLVDWYAPHVARASVASGAKATFGNLWRQVLGEVVDAPATWNLRDYHSPNLIWLPERDGLRRVGIIDFQDCVLGHPAYDLVSLLHDARVTVSDELELRLLSIYAKLRREADPHFDMAAFIRAYAILGAQRSSKILGIFARLDKRDHKPHYLAHLPRVRHYLVKSLAHPVLAEIKAWYAAHLPQLFEG